MPTTCPLFWNAFTSVYLSSGSTPAKTANPAGRTPSGIGPGGQVGPSRPTSCATIPAVATGDAPATAAIVAHEVGLDGPTCPPGPIPEGVRPAGFAVFAGVLPEDKYTLVKA